MSCSAPNPQRAEVEMPVENSLEGAGALPDQVAIAALTASGTQAAKAFSCKEVKSAMWSDHSAMFVGPGSR